MTPLLLTPIWKMWRKQWLRYNDKMIGCEELKIELSGMLLNCLLSGSRSVVVDDYEKDKAKIFI